MEILRKAWRRAVRRAAEAEIEMARAEGAALAMREVASSRKVREARRVIAGADGRHRGDVYLYQTMLHVHGVDFLRAVLSAFPMEELPGEGERGAGLVIGGSP